MICSALIVMFFPHATFLQQGNHTFNPPPPSMTLQLSPTRLHLVLGFVCLIIAINIFKIKFYQHQTCTCLFMSRSPVCQRNLFKKKNQNQIQMNERIHKCLTSCMEPNNTEKKPRQLKTSSSLNHVKQIGK